jgi:membrane-bound lytic murein transglycosylase D
MEFRTKAILVLASLGAALFTAGCGSGSQATRFQRAFLPPAAPSAPGVELAVPPSLSSPRLYSNTTPGNLLTGALRPQNSLKADSLFREADLRFQRGKRFYQQNNPARAREEFNAAVDLTLEASTENPAGRLTYERSLDNIIETIHRFDLADEGGAAGVGEAEFEKAPLEDILEMTFPVDPKLKDKVREQVSATVSQLPLSYNDTVLSYIQYFSARGHKTMMYGLQRSGRYRPMIRRVLDEEGVPQELIHLAQAESGFMPRAMSRMKAGGMWQFLVSRGKEYGLNRNEYMDERMDPEKATRAAAKHLRDLYQEFGDWYLAIAAYNCGPVNVERAVERTGSADFWELRSRGVLPAETTAYVPIILAMALMSKNAAEYGLEDIVMDPPVVYDTVELDSPTSLALISDIAETPMADLNALNPAMLKSVAPAGYAVHVPKGTGNSLTVALQSVPSEKRTAWRMHRVGSGESLEDIAKIYSASVNGIVQANKLETPETVEGDRLIVPAAPRSVSVSTARKSATRTASSKSKSRAKASGQTASAGTSKHTSPSSKKAAASKTASGSSRTAGAKSSASKSSGRSKTGLPRASLR